MALLVALSWWFLATGAGLDHAMHMGVQPPLAALIVMWWLMMIAMMLPSAAPTILLYARVRQQRGTSGQVAQPWIFLSGYVFVWLLFSLLAAAAQRLAGAGTALLHPDVASGLLIAAGLYQLSPVKNACLRQCRAPAEFLSRYWRPGAAGAVRLGVLHGAYCVGCCWMLMALLFVGGVMNFAWIAALTLIVAIEKLVPRGDIIGRAAGMALIAWGVVRLAT